MSSFLSSLFKSHKSDPNQLYNNQNTLIDINNAIYLATDLFTRLPNIGLNISACFHINSYGNDKFMYFYFSKPLTDLDNQGDLTTSFFFFPPR